MAFIVLFSTVSFTVDMHFCGDTLVDLSFFQEAATCGMEVQKSSSSASEMTKMNCCSDEQIVLEGQDELNITFDNLSFEQQLFISSFVYSYVNLFESLPKQVNPFKEYSPPLLITDIQLVNETFLI